MIKLKDLYLHLIDSLASSRFKMTFYQYDNKGKLIKMSELYNYSLSLLNVVQVNCEYVNGYYLVEIHLKGDVIS